MKRLINSLVVLLLKCMTNAVRDLGIVHSLDLPDKTLQFVRDQPLLDGAVPPLTGGPLVLQRGAKLSVIVVDRVMAVDGEIHHVMFIGTGTDYSQPFIIQIHTVLCLWQRLLLSIYVFMYCVYIYENFFLTKKISQCQCWL